MFPFDCKASTTKGFSERGNFNVGSNVVCAYWDNPSASWTDRSILASNGF